MKKINSILLPALFILFAAGLASCGGAETKADSSDTVLKKDSPGSVQKEKPQPAPDNKPAASPKSRGLGNEPGTNEILSHIDKYLVSKAIFSPPPASGGISNASITLKNTLDDITFQKVILEVSIVMADGAEFRTDYYVIQNLEPGELQTIKIPNAARGNSIVSHVVKLKSNVLTNGEMILVGTHFVPPQ